MKFILVALLGLFASLSSEPARSQTPVALNCYRGPTLPLWVPCDTNNPLAVNATVSASITGFAPATTGTPITATTGGVTGTLPAGAVVIVTNAGTTNGAYCKLGASSTLSDQYIAPGGGWFSYTVGGATQLTCITSAGTTTVNMVGGSGLPTGAGGALASTGSNSAASATGAGVPAQASYTGVNSGGTLVGLPGDITNGAFVNVKTSVLPTGASTSALQSTINTTLGAPFQAGGSIGNTTFAVTNTGTFAVQAAQSGTWTVQPGNTANTTAWLVTGTGGTFPATQSGTWNINAITTLPALPANQSVNVAQFGGVSTATGQVAVSTAPVTATNTALVVDLRPDSPGIINPVTPVIGGSAASSLVLKASAGSLFSVYAECSAACWLMVFNSTTAPSNGSTTAGINSGNMQDCVPIAAGGTGSINYTAAGPPEIFTVGMTAAISSTTCATLTLATTGFIHGMVQ